MKDIIKEIEFCSAKVKDLVDRYSLNTAEGVKSNPTANLLMWKWHEQRRGMIRACAMLGVRVEVVDREGLKWAVTGVAE